MHVRLHAGCLGALAVASLLGASRAPRAATMDRSVP
jgi:hypothetical protein